MGLASRVTPVHTALRNSTRDEGGPFGFDDQESIPSHRKLLWSKAMVVSVAEKAGHDHAAKIARARRRGDRVKRRDFITRHLCLALFMDAKLDLGHKPARAKA